MILRGRAVAINPDVHMWRSVLLHGLHDAAKGTDAGWIGSAGFRTVCALAGVEPKAVLRAYAPERFMRLGKVA